MKRVQWAAELERETPCIPVVPGGGAKSISVEQTYDIDLDDDRRLETALLRHCDRLSARLNAAGLAGRTITLKVRFGDFTTLTRSATVPDPIDHTPDLWDLARTLLAKIERGGRGVRLLGIGASTLISRSRSPRQLSLDNPGRDAAALAAEEVLPGHTTFSHLGSPDPLGAVATPEHEVGPRQTQGVIALPTASGLDSARSGWSDP